MKRRGSRRRVKVVWGFEYPAELFQVVVIADNCDDGTAQVAGREGAQVLERHDLARKSKGYAIEYLLGRLQSGDQLDSLDALVVIDADSTARADLLRGSRGLLERA